MTSNVRSPAMLPEASKVFEILTDLPDYLLESCRELYIDIETNGLDHEVHSIGAIQVYDTNSVWILRPPFAPVGTLSQLLLSRRISKTFHHAAFDLRFLKHKLSMEARHVRCTKIAAKILHPDWPDHTLATLADRLLGVALDKTARRSDWLSLQLSPAQVAYATRDAVVLMPLIQRLLEQATAEGLTHEIEGAFEFLPVQVSLRLRGIKELFDH